MDLKKSLTKFETAFWEGCFCDSSSTATWKAAYLPYLRRLELAGEQQITAGLLVAILESYAPMSSSRRQCGQVLGSLARSANVELPDNWEDLAAGYKPPAKNNKQAITDNQIVKGFAKIPNKQWKTAYGLVATYGLRNYEVFFCDFSQMSLENHYALKVIETKNSKHRIVYPLHFNWVTDFQLTDLSEAPDRLPCITARLKNKGLRQVGSRIAEQLKRYGVGITASDLRHAWALRAIDQCIPDSVVSKMMGIDPARFFDEYSSWIDDRDMKYIRSGAWPQLT